MKQQVYLTAISGVLTAVLLLLQLPSPVPWLPLNTGTTEIPFLSARTIAGQVFGATPQTTAPQRAMRLTLSGTAQNRASREPAALIMPVMDFESFGSWRRGDEVWGSLVQSSEERAEGSYSGKLFYSFPAVPDNYLVFRRVVPIPGYPDALRIQVYGNGSTHFLNVWIQDANDQLWQFSFGRIRHTGWQSMLAPLDLSLGWPNEAISGVETRNLVYPLRFSSLVLDGFSSEQTSQGVIYVDDLEAVTYMDSPNFTEAITEFLSEETPPDVSGSAAVITVNKLNVRSGPGTHHQIIGTVAKDETLPIVRQDRVSGWVEVDFQTVSGWISDSYIRIEPLSLTEGTSVHATTPVTETELISTTSPQVAGPTALALPFTATAERPLSGRIAFPSFAGGTYAIYVIEASGKNMQRVVSEASQPALSNEGRRLAFRSWKEAAPGLAITNISGGDVITVSTAAEDARPVWSPDGETLLFFSRRQGDGNPRIYQASVADGRAWALPFVEGEHPNWMPDGRIVYRAVPPPAALTIADSNGDNPIPLVNDSSAIAPATSPDGRFIVFMSNRNDNWDLYRVGASGGDPVRLTANPSREGLPAWSPDGQHIAFVTDRDGYWAIWIMNSDGTEQRELLAIPGSLERRWLNESSEEVRGWLEERISWSR